MSNTITIELCAEDRARLDNILKALEGMEPKCDKCMGTVLAAMGDAQEASKMPQEEPKKEEPKNSTLATEKPQETEQTQPQPQASPSVSRADIQRKVVELSAAGKKAQVRDIVKAVATKVSDIPEDKLDEIWQQLTALEG